MTVTPIPHSLNTTLHPALHNVTTDTRECDNIPGMTCPVLAALGNSRRSSSRLSFGVSLVPSGIVTVIGSVATVCLGSRNKYFFCFHCLLLLIGQARRYG